MRLRGMLTPRGGFREACGDDNVSRVPSCVLVFLMSDWSSGNSFEFSCALRRDIIGERRSWLAEANGAHVQKLHPRSGKNTITKKSRSGSGGSLQCSGRGPRNPRSTRVPPLSTARLPRVNVTRKSKTKERMWALLASGEHYPWLCRHIVQPSAGDHRRQLFLLEIHPEGGRSFSICGAARLVEAHTMWAGLTSLTAQPGSGPAALAWRSVVVTICVDPWRGIFPCSLLAANVDAGRAGGWAFCVKGRDTERRSRPMALDF